MLVVSDELQYARSVLVARHVQHRIRSAGRFPLSAYCIRPDYVDARSELHLAQQPSAQY